MQSSKVDQRKREEMAIAAKLTKKLPEAVNSTTAAVTVAKKERKQDLKEKKKMKERL